MATCTETFRVDRDQLDANFDGYKLSLDPLPVYSVNVDSGVDEVKLQENQYSLQHVRAFGVHNYLLLDQWNPNSVFYVDDQWKVMQLRVVLESQLSPAESVFQIPATNHKSASNRHFVTFHFPGPHWALLADGAGTLYILETGNRDQVSAPEWKIIYSESLCGSERPFVILDATLHISDSATTVDCLLLYIEEEKTDTMLSSSHFTSVIEWITITRQPETPHFQVERKRKLHSKAAPQFAALEPSGYAVHISADYDFNIVEDSLKPVEKKETPKPLEKSDTIYSWTQTLEDVTVTFVLPDGTNKSDIDIKLSCKDISIGIKNSFTLLQGILHAKIDVDVSTWTVEKRKLELTLMKAESGPFWPEVVSGDKRGEYVVDSDEAKKIHERLSHLTSEQLSLPGESDKPAYNTQELEECDAFPEDTSALTRIDGNLHQITNKVSLGSHQWLFNVQIEPEKAPGICIRHDVDGLIWQPGKPTEDEESPWKHVSTFNALGYVQASKRERKFATCAADFSYSTLCDCSKHIYIYRQCKPKTPLRNRKTGQVVRQVAKQQVVSLDSIDEILGFQACKERLYILTAKRLYIVRMTSE